MLMQEQIAALQAGSAQANGGVPQTAQVAVTDITTAAKNKVEFLQGGAFPPGTAPSGGSKSSLTTILMLIVILVLVWWLLNLSERKFEEA